jgi:eukaryotic-like serine/threonine-protein kinase
VGKPKTPAPVPAPVDLDDIAQFEASLRSSVRRRQWVLPTLLLLTAAGGGGHYLWSHGTLPFLGAASAEAAVATEPEPSAEADAPSETDSAQLLSPHPSDALFASPQPMTAQDTQPAAMPAEQAAPAREPTPGSSAPAQSGLVDFRLVSATRVLLNGQEVGVTPFMPLEIPEGRHTVRFINAALAKDVTRTISVKAGRTYILKYNLNQD